MMPIVRPWTEADIEKLKSLGASGASLLRCAAALKRPIHGVRRQALVHGVVIVGIREARRRQRAAETEATR